MAEEPGQYSRSAMGPAPSLGNPASQFLESEGLGSISPSQSGVLPSPQNPNLWTVRDESGSMRGIDAYMDAGAKNAEQEAAFLLPEIANTQRDIQYENALAYALLTGNSSLLGLAVDDKGFTQNYLSGAVVYGDNRNWAINAAQINLQMANSWYNSNPGSRRNVPIPEAARKFLEASGVDLDKKALKDAAVKAMTRGGSGRVSTVRTVQKMDGQNIRATGDATARQTIGRTIGVGEADRLSKRLNKESAKSPAVTTGLGTGSQTTTPGYNFSQGIKDALSQTADAEAYSKVVRGVNILGRVLGGQL